MTTLATDTPPRQENVMPENPSKKMLPSNTPPDHTVQTIVLAGNPNVGKSVVFNALSGQYTSVSNYPGTTVDVLKATLPSGDSLQDTPGVYGLSNFSEEEEVAAKAILNASVVINVVNATTLERDLFLTQQIIDYQRPMLVVLNQMDEVAKHQIEIDLPTLEAMLGVPVLPCTATTGEGLKAILPTLPKARIGHKLNDCPAPESLFELERHPTERLKLYGLRRAHINAITATVITSCFSGATASFAERTGRALLNPFVGSIAALAVLIALYQVIGVWVAGDLVNLLETGLLDHVIPLIQSVFKLLAPVGHPVFEILAGEFGLFTMTLQYILGVMLPLVFGFYLYISLLEDCGYLPRVAVLCDSALTRIGLNGRAVIPIILGLGCVTMASVSTRVLTSQRERTIASVILAITIPCSAQIGVMMGLISLAGGLPAFMGYVAILLVVLAILGAGLNKVLPGRSTGLIMDLPPLRRPLVRNVLKKTWIRSVSFLKEATPLFALGALLISIAQITGVLDRIEDVIAPITVQFLKLPKEAGQMFVMGLVRRDFGAAGLYMMAETLSAAQILTALVTITLFVPCFASATIIFKERGWIESTCILIGSWVIAFITGGIVAQGLGLFL